MRTPVWTRSTVRRRSSSEDARFFTASAVARTRAGARRREQLADVVVAREGAALMVEEVRVLGEQVMRRAVRGAPACARR